MTRIVLYLIILFVCLEICSCDPPISPRSVIKGSFIVTPNVAEIKLGDTVDVFFERSNIFVEDSLNNVTSQHDNGRLGLNFRLFKKNIDNTSAIAYSDDYNHLIVKGTASYSEREGYTNAISSLSAAFENKKYIIHLRLVPQKKGVFWIEVSDTYFNSKNKGFNAYGDINFEGNNLHHELLLDVLYMEGYLQHIPTAKRIYAFEVK